MQLQPHHIGIIVSDMQRSQEFYSALGFVLVNEHADEAKTIAFMELGPLQVELFAYRVTPPAAEQSAPRVLGFRHFALQTASVASALAELRERGLIPDGVAVREVPGLARLAFIRDPDGMEIEIMQSLDTHE